MLHPTEQAITLQSFNELLSDIIAIPATTNRWVTAELLDVNLRGGHCYMELIDKNVETGKILARNRGIIWANNYSRIAAVFFDATGQRLATGLKVLVRVSANFHSVFGLSLVITDIDPAYTMGELQKRRMLILKRLKEEGILDMNRTLTMPVPANRIAVISATGAAGYGDFIHQLYSNPRHLRFTTRLFESVMQGERAPGSIIDALRRIASDTDSWDAVVIIRGGGSTSDLATLDSYELAAHIAQFPLPVIVGVGHERDETVLDYVAAIRVKTPTAAAELLIANGAAQLDRLHSIASDLLRITSARMNAATRRLEFCAGSLPGAVHSATHKASASLDRYATLIASAGAQSIASRRNRIDSMSGLIVQSTRTILTRHADRLNACHRLIDILSPEATLRRGYSITRINGHSITDASGLHPGDIITTTFANGTTTSSIIK